MADRLIKDFALINAGNQLGDRCGRFGKLKVGDPRAVGLWYVGLSSFCTMQSPHRAVADRRFTARMRCPPLDEIEEMVIVESHWSWRGSNGVALSSDSFFERLLLLLLLFMEKCASFHWARRHPHKPLY